MREPERRDDVGAGVVVALLGFVLGVFSLVDPLVSGLVLALSAALFGAVLGAVIGAITHAMSGGERDFSAVSGMQAGRYDVVVDAEVADDARTRLGSAALRNTA
jgi:hypothetical protein